MRMPINVTASSPCWSGRFLRTANGSKAGSEGIPVLVTLEDGKKELILGYDSVNIWVYDAESNLTARKAISDAEADYGTHSSRYTAFLQ